MQREGGRECRESARGKKAYCLDFRRSFTLSFPEGSSGGRRVSLDAHRVEGVNGSEHREVLLER